MQGLKGKLHCAPAFAVCTSRGANRARPTASASCSPSLLAISLRTVSGATFQPRSSCQLVWPVQNYPTAGLPGGPCTNIGGAPGLPGRCEQSRNQANRRVWQVHCVHVQRSSPGPWVQARCHKRVAAGRDMFRFESFGGSAKQMGSKSRWGWRKGHFKQREPRATEQETKAKG